MQPDPPFVSIVIPVRNEERILGRCLESLAALEYPRHRFEVIVADSLSTDNSRLIAQQFGATVVPNQGQTVVSGRNCGFAASRGEFVAFTDADCIVRRDWLKTGVHALGPEGIAGVGGVTLFPEDATAFQKAVNVLFLVAGFAGATCHRQSIAAAHTVADIPGCNAIYRRSALETVMPLDERLLTAEDVWLNWLLRSRGFRHVVSENMVLWHHRRSRPRSFFRQMYRFAIGRLQVGKRNRRLLRPLHVIAGAALPLVAAALVAAAFVTGGFAILASLALAAGAAAVIAGIAKTRSVRAGLCVPFVLAVFLLAWSLGFLREWLFPLREVNGK
ncbi:MAG: glycosyltransferase [Acidobacteriia bacterium]|nr:glycosyltransferase [Terriglobia bacterium]